MEEGDRLASGCSRNRKFVLRRIVISLEPRKCKIEKTENSALEATR